MPDFNIVPQVGGVDTLNPERIYDRDEQFAVIQAMFGGRSRHGAIKMPSGLELYVGSRNKGKRGYSLGRKDMEGTEWPALFIGEDKPDNPNCLFDGAEGLWTPNEGAADGFILKAIQKVLIQGKHTMREVIRGEQIDYSGQASARALATSARLARLAFASGVYEASEEHDPTEAFVAELAEAIDAFLGPTGLNDVEIGVKNSQKSQYDWSDGPIESLVVGISGRVADIVEVTQAAE